LKTAHAVDIASLIRRVVGGEHVRPGSAGTPELTHRERSILSALAAGMTTAAISRELWISEHAITLHLTNIYRKLGVTGRADALRRARADGSAQVGRPAGSDVETTVGPPGVERITHGDAGPALRQRIWL
jgi:DNA-binding CsgD family transcriptional regulator